MTIRQFAGACAGICTTLLSTWMMVKAQPEEITSPIQFVLQTTNFGLNSNETQARNAPETMAGGVAAFDYNGDGRPDIYLTNGANLATLKKDAPDYRNHLLRNDGNGKFTDVAEAAGVAGDGFDVGVAVADYDNDGRPDLFVAGVHRNTLYHNNGDGTFTNVTVKAGLGNWVDPEFGPLWSVAAAWVDVNNDGLLDLFVVHYLQWTYGSTPLCSYKGVSDYCHPRFYKGQANQLFLNNGDGTFRDVSKEWGIRKYVGKGMGVGVADYDLDGKQDLFITNDAYYNTLLHNLGDKFEDVAFNAGVALPDDGNFASGMGLDFRDANNDQYPDNTYVALNNQTFPLLFNTGKGDFRDVTDETGIRKQSTPMAGYGALLWDFDNDGWKDLFVTRGHASLTQPGADAFQPNTVFRNPGLKGQWTAYTAEAGFAADAPARHRGCAPADLDGDGRTDVVATALQRNAEIWMNRSPGGGHWLDVALEGKKSNRDGIGARIKVVSKSGVQYNHMTTSVCYASSSDVPVHFGLGPDEKADLIEIHWPSGIVQSVRNIDTNRVLHVAEKPDTK